MFLYSTCIHSVGPFKAFYTTPLGRPVHSGTNLTSLGSILAKQQLWAKTKSLTFPQPSIARYLLIYTTEWRKRKCPNFETVTNGIRTRALSIASPHSTVMSHGRENKGDNKEASWTIVRGIQV